MRLLLLGGTAEARALAEALDTGPVEVISSLAGRVRHPRLPVGAVRLGGFGGADGLATFLRDEAIDAVVDATHPFAATITRHATHATAGAGCPLLVLRRPGWTERPGDVWTRVPDIVAAAGLAATSEPGTVFLTTGRRDLAAFAGDDRHHYLVRTVDRPDEPVPPRSTVLLARGPYTVDGERALMSRHDVTLLVTKDSGGELTVAKLDAARELRVPCVVIDRPPVPDGVAAVPDVGAAVRWVAALQTGRTAQPG